MIKVMNIISDTNIGGAGKDLITYCNNYDRQKFDLVVVIPKDSLLKNEIQKANVRIIELDGLRDKSFDVPAIPKLIKIIKCEKPDIVHTHSSLSARIAAKCVNKIKVVYSKHCAFSISKKYKYKAVRMLNRYANNLLADRITATAEIVKDNLIQQGNDEQRIDVVLNGVDGFKILPDEKKNEIRARYGIRNDDIVIGILARIERLKGHEYLVNSAKILKDKGYNNLKFLVIGTGSYEQELKNEVKKLDVENEVIFTGFIQNVEEILNIVDIQVNASYESETTNLALLEGMSLGIPAIATRCAGNSKVIRDNENGILVNIKDSVEIANGIEVLLKDKERYNRMKEKSIEIFNNEYTSKIYTKNIEKVYESMVNENEDNRK